ncbi:hypothetical protein ACSTKS_23365, partial [Vibrio parahaemolyticus]
MTLVMDRIMDDPRPAAGALRVLMVDPSLFTAPYDAALSGGLAQAGVRADWATRALRPGEEAELD